MSTLSVADQVREFWEGPDNLDKCGGPLPVPWGYCSGLEDVSKSVLFNNDHKQTASPRGVEKELEEINQMFKKLPAGGGFPEADVDVIIDAVQSLWNANSENRESKITIMKWLNFWAYKNASGEILKGIWRNSKLENAVLIGLGPVCPINGEPDTLGSLVCVLIREGCKNVDALDRMVVVDIVEWLMERCVVKGTNSTYLTEIVQTLWFMCSKSLEAQVRMYTPENIECLKKVPTIHDQELLNAVCCFLKVWQERLYASNNAAAGLGGK